MQLDDIDKAIVGELSKDGRASYSEISTVLGVSTSTIRNRITKMRAEGALHLNVWLDPYRAGLGVNATLLLRVEPGRIAQVAAELAELAETGYVATVVGAHDILVDAFCHDVPHLSTFIHDEVQSIVGVAEVTSYLVTDIKYESSINLLGILSREEDTTDPDQES